jgi:hypothetical protein
VPDATFPPSGSPRLDAVERGSAGAGTMSGGDRVCDHPGEVFDCPAATPLDVEVLVATRDRPVELAVTLAGLAAQPGGDRAVGGQGTRGRRAAGGRGPRYGVLVSDQSDDLPSWSTPSARSLALALRLAGRPVRFTRHLPRHGLAEHRAFLLSQASAPYVLFLDDDVWLEPGVIARLYTAIRQLRCGLVGAAVAGLSHADDVRPHELEPFELVTGRPQPETVTPDSPAHRRCSLHHGANPLHLAQRLQLPEGQWCAYRIAWVGGCVLYDRRALLDCGGFDFGAGLPPDHRGEDVVAQWRVMARYGGVGVLPTGTVHLESPTTVVGRGNDLPDLLHRRERTAGRQRWMSRLRSSPSTLF